MEVERKSMPGCAKIFVYGVLTVFTGGVFPIYMWLHQRKWPKSVNEQGLITRGGTHIAWDEFTKIIVVMTKNKLSGETYMHHELISRKGKITLEKGTMVNGQEIVDYIFKHLPKQAETEIVDRQI